MSSEESKRIMAQNIRRYMDRKGVSNQQLCDALGFKYTTFLDWIKGVTYPRIGKVEAMANYFGCEKSDLIEERTNGETFVSPTVTDDVVIFPVIGEVAAGFEHIAAEDWTGDKIEVPKSMLHGRKQEDFFVLSVIGDSMYPLYMSGDKVLILKQSTLNRSGDIGVIRYDGDKASLKKVEYVDGENWLRMVPINPLYQPETISGSDLERCAIIGIPTLLIREIKP